MRNSKRSLIGVSLVLVYLFFVFLFRFIFEFDFFVGDSKTYWQLSQSGKYLFDSWWVPGYPFLLVIFRSITFNMVNPTILMQIISGLGYVIGGMIVFRTFEQENAKTAAICVALFALFPFAGIIYSVIPIADSLALASLAFCFFFLLKKKWLVLGISIAIASLLQKITWFFLPLLVLYPFIRYKQSRPYLIMSVLPLLGYYSVGILVKQDLFWLFRWSAENLLTTKSILPIFDGLIGPLLGDISNTKLLRAIVVFGCFFATLLIFFSALYRKHWETAIIPTGLLIMVIIINQYEIWSFVRYSKLLAIPAGYILLQKPKILTFASKPWVFFGSFFVCLLSNVMYGYYLAKIFY